MAAAPAEPAWPTPETTYQEYLNRGDLDGGELVAATGREYDAIEWANADGDRHRNDDLPAFIDSNGYREWSQHGEYHRDDDKPAKVFACGSKEWYKDGQRYRDGDRPAMINPEMGSKRWYKDDRLHRDGDLPAVRYSGGDSWYKHGQLHRDNDMPARISTYGTQEWFMYDRRHRGGGLPAIIFPDGDLAWYDDGYRTGDNESPPEGATFPGQLTKPCRTLR